MQHLRRQCRPCWNPPAHAARNCTPATPDVDHRATNVRAAKGVAPKRTADCSTTRMAASAAAWLSSKHADASSHMAGSHAAPTCISHARHRVHRVPAHSPLAQNVLKSALPCRWPQLSRMATCVCVHVRPSDHTGVGQVSHGGKRRRCCERVQRGQAPRKLPRGWSQLLWWRGRAACNMWAAAAGEGRVAVRTGAGVQPRCLWRRGGGRGLQAGCGLAPGPTLLHALSAVVPVNVASIGEHSASERPLAQAAVRVVLPTSHYAKHGAVRQGGVRVLRRRRRSHDSLLSTRQGRTHSRGTAEARAARRVAPATVAASHNVTEERSWSKAVAW